MLAPEPTPEPGIGTLFSRLIDEGEDLVRAEIDLYREITLNRLLRSRTAVALAVGAVLLAQGAVTALFVALVLGFSRWLGPIGSGLAIAAIGLLVSALLLRSAMKRFAAAAKLQNGKESG